jgi:regulator of protease activity HflC (stomatin/prohibitin superfamily)
VLTRNSLKALPLRNALGQSDNLVSSLQQGLQNAEAIASLGIEVLGLSILAIKPTLETSRALEAEAREQILREADEAIYAQRNAAVEQERSIKENKLNTEIAIENKKRQI